MGHSVYFGPKFSIKKRQDLQRFERAVFVVNEISLKYNTRGISGSVVHKTLWNIKLRTIVVQKILQTWCNHGLNPEGK